MIRLEAISKTFKVAKRGAGFSQAARALFRKEYHYIKALNEISFTIPDGEIVGYIGPNGAGKSSTLKIMSGILTPDSGECVIDGLVPWRDRKKHVSRLGVVFGQRSQLWWDVPVADSFELIRDIYAVPQADYQKNLDALCDALAIGDLIGIPARQLSLGQRMRCEIAASLLHSPQILFLDEPTIGLDAVSKLAVRQFIRELNRTRGTTVILTTHDMQDIEALASRILLIGKGKILLDGSMDDLKRYASPVKTLTIEHSAADFPLLPGMKIITQTPGRCVIELDSTLLPVSKAVAHLSAHTDLQDLSVKGIDTEQMIADLYRTFEV